MKCVHYFLIIVELTSVSIVPVVVSFETVSFDLILKATVVAARVQYIVN